MTTEPTQPQQESGPAQTNGLGQSQGHRRRRRRRKNKSTQQGAPQAQNGQQPQQSQPQQTQSPMQAPPPQAQQGPPKQPRHQGGGARKKKKFFQKGAGGSNGQGPQPGNSIAHQGNGRRKDRQKGPRTFVGPMDHSYRVVNGNIADTPPSTIPTSNNGHSSYYADVYQPAPQPVREDAPTRILCFIDDLFFQAKIQETSRKLGVKVEFLKGDKDVLNRFDAPDATKPTLVVFDLNNANAKPLSLIPKFKAKFKKATSIIGFLNHLQGDLKAKAVEVGCDTVMPRSAFSQGLPNLLRRYGLEEEEESFPQPVL